MRKVYHKYIDLSVLPTINENIDWANSIGKEVYFEYNDIKGYFKILGKDEERGSHYIKILYDGIIYSKQIIDIKRVSFGSLVKSFNGSFHFDIGDNIKDEKRDLTILDKKYKKDKKGNKRKWYKVKCNICGWDEGWREEKHIEDNTLCPCCTGRIVVKGINDIATTNPELIKYFKNIDDAHNHTRGENILIDVICTDCGRIRKIKISQLSKQGMSCICGDGFSYPEKIFANILDQLNLKYIFQLSKKNFNWCENYRYDFYIPEYDIIIETHGSQHYNYSKGWNSGKSQEIIDKKKKTLALKNNITDYIELDCRKSDKEYIKDSILNSELINYFDFNKINWDKADEYATNNLIKEVCEYYELYKNDILMEDIAKKFNITIHTLKKYIKKGEKLGWCKYIKRYNSISYKRKFKKVKVIEDNKIFNNVNECINYYKKIGINFTLNSIRKNCRGETKTYKGFHFEYIDEE